MKVSRNLAQKIFERDEWKCRVCDRKVPPYYEVKWGGPTAPDCIVIDHIVPGAGNSEENLQALCWSCNTSKGSKSQEQFDIFRAIHVLGRPVAFYPSIAEAVGMKESLFLCQLIYWTPRAKNTWGDGWIYKSSDEMQKETALTYKEQLRARGSLRRFGILQEKYERTTHRMYFKVNPKAISRVIAPYQREVTHMPFSKVAPPHREVRQLPVGKFDKGTEITTENTQKDYQCKDCLFWFPKGAFKKHQCRGKELMVGSGPR